jgi:hypothetical protein
MEFKELYGKSCGRKTCKMGILACIELAVSS